MNLDFCQKNCTLNWDAYLNECVLKVGDYCRMYTLGGATRSLRILCALQGWQQTLWLSHRTWSWGHATLVPYTSKRTLAMILVAWSDSLTMSKAPCIVLTAPLSLPFPPISPHGHQESEHIIISHSSKCRAIWAISLCFSDCQSITFSCYSWADQLCATNDLGRWMSQCY